MQPIWNASSMDGHQTGSDRVLVIGLDGATWDLLTPLAESGVMPNLATLMRRSALARLLSTEPFITPVAWTSFQTGTDIAGHGIFDYRYWDHQQGRLCLNHAGRIGTGTLFEAVAAADRTVVSINLPMTHPPRLGEPHIILGGLDSPSAEQVLAANPRFAAKMQAAGLPYDLDPVWRHKPRSLEELKAGVDRTAQVFHNRAATALLADEDTDWGLMVVQFQTLDALQHRCWHLLVPDTQADRAWVAEAMRAMRALDEACGQLLELAERRRAAVVALSDHGFGSFEGKISVPRVLERQRLLVPASGTQQVVWLASRIAAKLSRWWWKQRHPGQRSASLALSARARVPLDWKRTRAVTLHGDLAAMVYLNRPERFGGGPLRTAAEIRQAGLEVCAALKAARHPQFDTPLFTDVYEVESRYDCDPLDRCWPDVVAIPADGWHTRSKWDSADVVVMPDAELTGTHRREGVLMIDAPGVPRGEHLEAGLWDVAPTILRVLGLDVPPSMTGRPLLHELPPRIRPNATAQQIAVPVTHNHASTGKASGAQPEPLSVEQLAVVEQRLRDLGYMD